MLTVAQRGVKASIEKAVILVWREHGMSIVRLGQLERIEYFAMLTVWDILHDSLQCLLDRRNAS